VLFRSAKHTYCIEALMQDKKALQAGTSHNLGQNFAKAFDVQFQDADGSRKYVYATSWGVSTRLIGALIMTHSDDNGVVIPPKLAQRPVVIIPIYRGAEEKEKVITFADGIYAELKKKYNVIMDDRDQYKPGYKFAEWELQGIPIRIEVGPKDVEKNSVVMVRRDLMKKEFVGRDNVFETVQNQLKQMQIDLLEKARAFRKENSFKVDSYDELKRIVTNEEGFVYAHWCGSAECEAKVKCETKATLRCISFESEKEPGKCICCEKKSDQRVVFSKAY